MTALSHILFAYSVGNMEPARGVKGEGICLQLKMVLQNSLFQSLKHG